MSSLAIQPSALQPGAPGLQLSTIQITRLMYPHEYALLSLHPIPLQPSHGYQVL